MGGKDEKLKPDDPGQSERFVETAKRLESDASGKLFERVMDVIARRPPEESELKKDK